MRYRARAAAGALLFLSAGFLSACAAPAYDAKSAPKFVAPPARDGLVHNSGSFAGSDGVRLFEQSWRPADGGKAVVVIVHGLKDHSSRYADFAADLVRHGYAVYGLDQRGHGYSEGRRVWVDTFEQLVADLDGFVRRVREREPGKPIFLFGHSMGGAVVTTLALKRTPDVRGLVLSGPALQVTTDVTPFKIKATRSFGKSNPRLAVFKMPDENFSRDERSVAALRDDPAVYHGAGPARMAAEVLGAIDYIQQHMEDLTLPVLALHGTADRLTNPDGSKALVERARSSDKALKLYPGVYHDLLHEPERAQVQADIEAWLDARAAAPR
ncbi:MAG: alpha/beta hydrolase [Polyangia bacterium]